MGRTQVVRGRGSVKQPPGVEFLAELYEASLAAVTRRAALTYAVVTRCTWPSLAEDCQRESSPRSQSPRPARSCVLGLCSLPNPIEAFRQLDVRAPRILDERDRDIERRDLGVRAFGLDTVRLELLGERLEVLHLEPDVIDRPSLRPDDRIGRGREVERHSREIGRHEGGGGVWGPRLGTERLRIPLPHLHVLLA